MEKAYSAKAHFDSIESVVIKLIREAKTSVFIVMAWLTSEKIKYALLVAKRRNPDLTIEIVVDHNDINEHSFSEDKQPMEEIGIIFRTHVHPRFLHRKFMVIDGLFTLLGSYNYTGKARRNAENVALIKEQRFSEIHLRVFRAMTDVDYVDENIRLLHDHPDFAQKLLSAYYPFNWNQYKKYRSKITNGFCYTHPNGMYDEIKYEPGFIFNKKCWMDRKLINEEFGLPVKKEIIKSWLRGRNESLIFDGYREVPGDWDELSEDLEKNEDSIDFFFQAVFESTYTYEELTTAVKERDMIIEDRLWPDNFALFLNDQLVDDLFSAFPEIRNSYDDYEMLTIFKHRLTRKRNK